MEAYTYVQHVAKHNTKLSSGVIISNLSLNPRANRWQVGQERVAIEILAVTCGLWNDEKRFGEVITYVMCTATVNIVPF